VNLRAKLLILFVAGSLAPVLLGGWLFYRSSLKVVGGMLREEVEAEASRVAHDVETALRAREVDLSELAQASAVRDYARGVASQPVASSDSLPAPDEAGANMPESMRAALAGFVSHNRDYYTALTLVAASRTGSTPFRIEPPGAGNSSPRVTAGDALPDKISLDERVWTTSEAKPLRSNVTRNAEGIPCIVYTVPVFSPDDERSPPHVALVAELKLEALLQEAGRAGHPTAFAANAAARAGGNGAQAARLLLVLDKTGLVVHHTSYAFKYQPAGVAMPYFDVFARDMAAGGSGTDFYTVPADGNRWLAAYKPVAGSDLSVAAAGNYTRAVASLKRDGLTSLALVLLAAGAATLSSSPSSRAPRAASRASRRRRRPSARAISTSASKCAPTTRRTRSPKASTR
jgi:hypothetical protein